MNIERYTFVRNELIRLHSLFTARTFVVMTPLSNFLSLQQLEHYQKNPPINGLGALEEAVERPYTIERLLLGMKRMGEEIKLGFRYPREDIPVVYESIQLWIQYWIEIKTTASYLQTPTIEELELIEKLGRFVFTAYAHFHHEKINRTMRVTNTKELTLIEVMSGRMQFGSDFDEPISYISYLDQYKSETGYVNYGINSVNQDGTLDFLRGFGGGL